MVHAPTTKSASTRISAALVNFDHRAKKFFTFPLLFPLPYASEYFEILFAAMFSFRSVWAPPAGVPV